MFLLALPLIASALVAQDTNINTQDASARVVNIAQDKQETSSVIKLPAPSLGSFTLEKALRERQSIRNLTGPALNLATLSQLLWSAQGENRAGTGRRTVPSASARYPLELYVIVAKSESLPEGVYKYSSKDHTLTKTKDGNPETLLGSIERMQPWIPKSPAVFIFAGVSSRFPGSDAMRKETNTAWESGAAAQAMLLAVVANGLGATVANGVNLDAIHTATGLLAEEKISVIIPVGRIAK